MSDATATQPPYRRWGDDELTLLRDAWARGGLASAREVLPTRTVASLHLTARRLGLSTPRLWREDELATLRQAWASGGLKAACAALPHRTPRSCEDKYYRLLTDPRGANCATPRPVTSTTKPHMVGESRRPWTTAELKLLREAWARGGLDAAVKALPGRSRGALLTCAGKHFLRCSEQEAQWDAADVDFLKRLYPRLGAVGTAQRMTWRSPAAITRKACMLGLLRRMRGSLPVQAATREVSAMSV